MVKISKNAKKLLALTLAGVMTVGTVVPGSALSTVENVQAASNENIDTVVNEINSTFSKNIKKYYMLGDKLTVRDKAIIIDAVKALDIVDNATIAENDDVIGKTKINVTLTNGDSFTTDFSLGAGDAYLLTAEKVAATWNPENLIKIEINDVATSTEITNKLTNAINAFNTKNETLKSLGVTYGDNADLSNYKVTLTQSKVDADKNQASVDVTVTGNTGDTFVIDDVNVVVNTIDSNLTKIENALDSLTEVTGADKDANGDSYGKIDITYTADATKQLCDVVLKKAQDIAKTVTQKAEFEVDWDKTAVVPQFNKDTMTFVGTLEIKNTTTGLAKTKKITINVKDLVSGIKSVEILGAAKDVDVIYPAELTTVSLEGVTLRAVLNDGTVLRYNGDAEGKFTEETATRTSFDQYFILDRSDLTGTPGTHTVKVTAKDVNKTVAEFPVTIYAKGTLAATEFNNTAAGSEEFGVKSATTSSADLKITNADDFSKPETKQVALKTKVPGNYTVTVINDAGVTYNVKVTVAENGKYTFEKEKFNGIVNVENVASVLGIKATEIEKITLDGNKTDAIDVELKDGKIVVSANEKTGTLVDGGRAVYVNVKGGEYGKLTSYFWVQVADENQIRVGAKVDHSNVASIELTDDLTKALNSKAIDNGADVVKVLGLTTEQLKVNITGGEVDYVPVTDADLSVSGGKIIIKYGKAAPIEVAVVSPKKIPNDVEQFGLVASGTPSVTKEDGHKKEPKGCTAELKNGELVITPIAGASTTDIVIVSDGLGTAEVTVVTEDGKITTANITKKFSAKKVTFPSSLSKTTFKLGEEFKVDEKITYETTDGKKKTIDITPEMLLNATSNNPKFTTGTVTANKVKTMLGYGGKTSYELLDVDGIYYLAVEPTTKELSNTELGLAADEKFVGFSYAGVKNVEASTKKMDKSILLSAQKINTKTTIFATTNKGNTITINASVAANGEISVDYFAYGKVVDINNTKEKLGLIGKNLVVSGDAVKAEINGSLIKITGEKAGDAVITVSDAEGHNAKISVTVDNKGNVTVTNIEKWLGYVPGWHDAEKGGWYYINEDGTMAKNEWVIVNGKKSYVGGDGVTLYSEWTNKIPGEEGTWYYFDKWGVAIKDGWKWIDGTCYFFEDHKMVRDRWIVDENGVKEGYVKYWGGAAANQWLKLDGSWYHFDQYAAVSKNKWVKSNNKWCFLAKDGVMAANKWVSWKGKYYYVDKNGYMLTNTYVGKYYVDKNGVWDKSKDKK